MNSATENSTASTRTEARPGFDQEFLMKALSNPEMQQVDREKAEFLFIIKGIR